MDKKQKQILALGVCLTIICSIIITWLIGYVNNWIIISLYSLSVVVLMLLAYGIKKNIEWLYKFMLTCFYIGIVFLFLYGTIFWSGIVDKFYDDNHQIKAELIAEAIGNEKGSKIIFVILSFLQVTFVPIPSTVSIVVGVILFGAGESYILSLIGQIAGSMLAFYLGKYFGEKLIIWIIGKEAFLKYHEIIRGRDKIILFFMFLFPMFPDDILCMFAGLTSFTGLTFFIVMLVTRSIAIGYTSFGVEALESIKNLGVWSYVIYTILAIIVFVLFIFVWKYGDKIETKMIKFFDKITPKRLQGKLVSKTEREILLNKSRKSRKKSKKNNQDNQNNQNDFNSNKLNNKLIPDNEKNIKDNNIEISKKIDIN